MLVLGGMLVFSGLLFAGFAPVAHQRLKRSVAWSKAVGALSKSPIVPRPAPGTLVAVRGTVQAAKPLEDPITSDAVVWYECEVQVGDDAPEMLRAESVFEIRDQSGTARVDPAEAREVSVRIDTFSPDDDRSRVAAFLARRGLGNRADVHIEHRQIAVGAELVVVGRWRGADESDASQPGQPALAAGDDGDLVLTTHSLEAFREREVASAKTGPLGVVILSGLSLVCTALGVVILAVA